ncbi:NAD(P)-binding protein [Viridothelium virens]|uniref:NAD(P)-binding protein n=1 Tax=Viridothelium virens TaxID=1048519 RepID=A0A6A6GUY1_VIRVR|nr:NAD(P)-binding protein [Viridothelium virens]
MDLPKPPIPRTNTSTVPSSLSSHTLAYSPIDRPGQINSLLNKTVLVTGIESALSHATALSFAHAGARVICVSHHSASLDALISEITATHPSAPSPVAITTDVSQPECATSIFSTIHDKLRVDDVHIDVLVLNTDFKTLRSSTPLPSDGSESGEALQTNWWRVLELKLRSFVAFVHAVLPGMRAQADGVVVSLVGASEARNARFVSADAVAEAAIFRFCHELGSELEGSGVRCFAMNSSHMETGVVDSDDTDRFEMAKRGVRTRKLERPELMADEIVKLCTEDRGRELNDRCLDCGQDLKDVIREADQGPRVRS